jgi:hypothetical protein
VNRIRVDLNRLGFQQAWFTMPAADAERVLTAIRKIGLMTWNELYQDRGLRWEAIKSRVGPAGQRLYSLRITQRIRAVGYRDGDFLRLEEIHTDHDSAYR